MRCLTTNLPDETSYGLSPTLADGGCPLDQDVHQITDDGCPLAPDPARWSDAEWQDDPSEVWNGQDNLGEMDTFDDEQDSLG